MKSKEKHVSNYFTGTKQNCLVKKKSEIITFSRVSNYFTGTKLNCPVKKKREK